MLKRGERSPSLNKMPGQFYIYILSNKYRTVFYTGMTNDLVRRIYEHKHKLVDGFTKKYNASDLLYYEFCGDVASAIKREKQIKNYRREKKLELIKSKNPDMTDLYNRII